MCGIFGLVSFDKNLEFKKLINQLFKLSESRGKEASGAVFRSENQIKYIKAPLSSSKLVASHSYKFELDSLIKKKGYNVVTIPAKWKKRTEGNSSITLQSYISYLKVLFKNI